MVIAAACGGGGSASPDKTSQLTSTVASGGAATSAAVPSGGAASPAADAGLARGKEIFEKTAGGVGCAFCHGMDGKGNGPAGVGAPANRGADETKVRAALDTVELMSSVKLTDEEIKAVVAYLAFLGKQP